MSRLRVAGLGLMMLLASTPVRGDEIGSAAMRASGYFDAWSLFGAPGRIGWLPDAGDAAAPPNTFAGLAFGSVRMAEETRAADRPSPGMIAVRTPIAWFDSLSTTIGGEGAWQGFEAGLFSARAVPLGGNPTVDPNDRAVGMFSFVRGSSAEEQTALSIARLDSLLPLRLEAMSIERGAVGSLERSGRHLWGASIGALYGVHRFDVAIAQRGTGTALPSGEDEAGTGLSGGGSWTWSRGTDQIRTAVARGYHHLESAGNGLPFSRRDADEIAADLDWSAVHSAGSRGIRLAWRTTEIDRVTAGGPEVHTSDDAGWLAVREQRALGAGRLSAALGGGWSRATDAIGWAPSLAWTSRAAGLDLRLVGERIVTPVWSDLAPGTDPFLQRTWVGGIDLAKRAGSWSATLGGRAGVTDDRALVGRDAIQELWLRRGVARDPEAYPFQLATGAIAVDGSWLSAGAEGFVLTRQDSDAQPHVDPGLGGRLFVESRFRVFADELGVRMRVEGVAVGERESERARTLGAYGMLDAVVVATLADAIMTFTVRNLTDLAVSEVWLDPRTGNEAQAPGREMRFALSWRLFN